MLEGIENRVVDWGGKRGLPSNRWYAHHQLSAARYIDSRAENGMTALHLAAVEGHLAAVNVLLADGASMMVRTVDLDMVSAHSIPLGSTPLHVAAQRGHMAILQAMLQVRARTTRVLLGVVSKLFPASTGAPFPWRFIFN